MDLSSTSSSPTLEKFPELEGLLDSEVLQTHTRPSTVRRAKSAFAAFWRQRPSVQSSPHNSRGASRTASFRHERTENAADRLSTTYLDGLKGIAALLAYWCHHEMWAHENTQGQFLMENAFGFKNQYCFASFPLIRVFFSGDHYIAALVLIISGYVLARKPLSLIQGQNNTHLHETLISGLFRRWFRLFMPVFAVTFLWMSSWHMLSIRSSSPTAGAPQASYLSEVWRWYQDSKNYSFIFNADGATSYNDHLWTIPVIFRGSLLVSILLLTFSRCTTSARLMLEAIMAWYFMFVVDGWYCSLFALGMLICDIDLLNNTGRLPSLLQTKPLKAWAYYLMLAVAFYLAGVPSAAGEPTRLRESPGWFLLSYLKPQAVLDPRWFYCSVAAVLTMVSVPQISSLRAALEGPICQYLGRISYAFYLVQGPILWSVGDRVYAATGRMREAQMSTVPSWINLFPFPKWGLIGLEANFLIPHFILLPLTLVVAEGVTKLIDERAKALSHYLYERATKVAERTEKV